MPFSGIGCAGHRIAGVDTCEPTGELRIRAERVGRRTVVVDACRTAPFHVGLPSHRAGDGSAELIVQGVGPGYLPGDRLAIDISVGEGASLAVRGQGATKLYPSPQGVPVVANVALTVERGGRLAYLPGELIPFRQSVLEQVTHIDVGVGGSLALGEILTPGRTAMGEIHQFTRLRLDVRARYNGRPCLIERARLEPAWRPLTSIGRHGEYPITGTLYLIGDGWTLSPAPTNPDGMTWASAKGDDYTFVRLLGPTVQAVSGAMRTLLA